MIYGSCWAERQYWNFDNVEPSFICSEPGCTAGAWTPEEHHQCIACKRRFCADCLLAIGGEKFCTSCAKCVCGERAIESCGDCGALLCSKCIGDREYCGRCDVKSLEVA